MIKSYQAGAKILLAVDCIVFGFDGTVLKILLVKRAFEPAKGQWSLIGGFLEKEEVLDTAAKRILQAYTGLKQVYLEQFHAYSEVNRDPGERTISVAYFALINIANHDSDLIKNYDAQWFSLTEVPNLIFDHNEMLHDAVQRMRYRTSIKPVGFELLPHKFSMLQLQKLYEAILDKKLDKRNFISKINSLDILIKLDEKDRQSSRKGSYLYTFDKQKYDDKLLNDFVLNL